MNADAPFDGGQLNFSDAKAPGPHGAEQGKGTHQSPVPAAPGCPPAYIQRIASALVKRPAELAEFLEALLEGTAKSEVALALAYANVELVEGEAAEPNTVDSDKIYMAA